MSPQHLRFLSIRISMINLKVLSLARVAADFLLHLRHLVGFPDYHASCQEI